MPPGKRGDLVNGRVEFYDTCISFVTFSFWFSFILYFFFDFFENYKKRERFCCLFYFFKWFLFSILFFILKRILFFTGVCEFFVVRRYFTVFICSFFRKFQGIVGRFKNGLFCCRYRIVVKESNWVLRGKECSLF